MKIYVSDSRVIEKVDFYLSELDSDVYNLMYKHYEENDTRKKVLLSTVYSKLTEIEELFEMYKEEVEKDE